MRLRTVTITGADEGTDPQALYRLSEEFPFVEWGILFGSRFGSRFPSTTWVSRFLGTGNEMKLSAHLCGRFCRAFLAGDWGTLYADELTRVVLGQFDRLQINTHGEPVRDLFEPVQAGYLAIQRMPFAGKHILAQIDGCDGEHVLQMLWEEQVRADPFFDLSHGAGVTPSAWPKNEYLDDPDSPAWCGYGGGLGPDNIAEQLPRIAEAAGGPFWIDMETQVRTGADLDLSKVRAVLKYCAPFIEAAR